MEITTEMDNGAVVARISGRVEGGLVATQFTEQLHAVLGDGVGAVVLDCEEMAYISSSGLRAIIMLVRNAQDRKVPVAACRMIPNVRDVFTVSGFDRIVDIHETREDALRAVSE